MKRQIIFWVLLFAFLLLLSSCGKKEETAEPVADEVQAVTDEQEAEETEETDEIETPVTDLAPMSSSLTAEGKWLTVINETYARPAGENRSPALEYNAITDAEYYAVYMIDVSAGNWIHWIAKDLTVTSLAAGEEISGSDYIGPYPPSGVHTYEIHIYALAAKPDSYAGTLNSTIDSINTIENALNVSGGQTGNILASAVLTGTVESGGAVVGE